MITTVATLALGFLAGCVVAGVRAAHYKRRWREALALVIQLDEGRLTTRKPSTHDAQVYRMMKARRGRIDA